MRNAGVAILLMLALASAGAEEACAQKDQSAEGDAMLQVKDKNKKLTEVTPTENDVDSKAAPLKKTPSGGALSAVQKGEAMLQLKDNKLIKVTATQEDVGSKEEANARGGPSTAQCAVAVAGSTACSMPFSTCCTCDGNYIVYKRSSGQQNGRYALITTDDDFELTGSGEFSADYSHPECMSEGGLNVVQQSWDRKYRNGNLDWQKIAERKRVGRDVCTDYDAGSTCPVGQGVKTGAGETCVDTGTMCVKRCNANDRYNGPPGGKGPSCVVNTDLGLEYTPRSSDPFGRNEAFARM